MRALAGNEGVHAFVRRALEVSSSAASDDADSLADLRSCRNNQRPGAGCSFQPTTQFQAGDFGFRLKSNELPMAKEKRTGGPKAQGVAKPGIVPEPRMGIKGEMGAVHS